MIHLVVLPMPRWTCHVGRGSKVCHKYFAKASPASRRAAHKGVGPTKQASLGVRCRRLPRAEQLKFALRCTSTSASSTCAVSFCMAASSTLFSCQAPALLHRTPARGQPAADLALRTAPTPFNIRDRLGTAFPERSWAALFLEVRRKKSLNSLPVLACWLQYPAELHRLAELTWLDIIDTPTKTPWIARMSQRSSWGCSSRAWQRHSLGWTGLPIQRKSSRS